MAKELKDLPSDVREKMPQGAQNIFLAALNSASDNGMSEDGALKVAWDTISYSYEESSDGSWQRKGADSGIHNKSITTGGN